jgi:putative nucleotidyltransferase with HDIG domain
VDVAGHARGTPEQQDLTRFLPLVVLATFAVIGLPALVAAWLQASLDLSAVVSMLCAVLLSLVAANLGSAYWMRRPESRNLVFGDLMAWGWLRRMRAEKRLSEANELLGANGLDNDRHVEVLTRLATSLEARDPYTYGHSKRVTRYSEMIATRMGLPEVEVAKIRTAAAVHDVGKINTPRAILMKPGRLTDTEFAVIQRHAPEGAAMVAGIGDEDITAMVCHHHERLDGTGYPKGLSGGEVPLGARIIAVADVFDAMTSSRPYRPARPHKRAMEILSEEAATKLDARAVGAFRGCYSGRRSVAWSALLVAAPQRLASWAGGALGSGGTAPLATGLSALGAAALLGGSVMGPVALGEEESKSGRGAVASSALTGSEDISRGRRPALTSARGGRSGGSGPRSRLRSLRGSPQGGTGGDAYQGAPGETVTQDPASPAPAAPPPPRRPPQPPQPPVAPTVPDPGPLPGLQAPELVPLPQVGDVMNGIGQATDGLGKTVNGLGLPGLP